MVRSSDDRVIETHRCSLAGDVRPGVAGCARHSPLWRPPPYRAEIRPYARTWIARAAFARRICPCGHARDPRYRSDYFVNDEVGGPTAARTTTSAWRAKRSFRSRCCEQRRRHTACAELQDRTQGPACDSASCGIPLPAPRPPLRGEPCNTVRELVKSSGALTPGRPHRRAAPGRRARPLRVPGC